MVLLCELAARSLPKGWRLSRREMETVLKVLCGRVTCAARPKRRTKGCRSGGRQAQMMPLLASMTVHTVAGIGPSVAVSKLYLVASSKVLTGRIRVGGAPCQGSCPVYAGKCHKQASAEY